MSERANQETAVCNAFKVIGTGGVLLKGKRVHLLKAVRPLMEQMRANGYYLSDRLVEQVARECGE